MQKISTPQKLIDKAQSYGFELSVVDNKVRGNPITPGAIIPQDLLAQIKENKAAIIKLLQAKPPTPTESSSRAEIKAVMKRLECGECNYIKIYSTTLKAYMYFIKDGDGIELPPERLVTFSLSELKQLVGSSIEHLKKVYLIKRAFNAKVVNNGIQNH